MNLSLYIGMRAFHPCTDSLLFKESLMGSDCCAMRQVGVESDIRSYGGFFMWEIYKITRDKDDAVYYGVHKIINSYWSKYDSRYSMDGVYMGSGVRIMRSIAKYGMDSHHKEVLDLVGTKEEAFRLERYFIAQAKLKGASLLNLTSGGFTWRYHDNSA